MAKQYYLRNWLKHLLLSVVLVAQLTGCLPREDEAVDRQVTGSVGDGPVTGATVTVYSAAGAVLGTVISDSSASFRSTVKVKGKDYPLRLVASGGTDLVTGSVPDFEMVSVVAHPSDKNANINPFSTLIVEVAESMPGGLNVSSVDAAKSMIMDKLGFGLDGNVVSDPVTTVVDNSNVAHIVKASEVLGEMVRRTRDLMAGTGVPASGDSVIAALADDMVDGVLDGQGGPAADAALAAVANVVSGQVMLEAASNNLKVSGAVATQLMDMSIISTHAGVSGSELTANVRITGGLLQRLEASLAAIQVLDQGQAVADIAATVSGLSADVLPGMIAAQLPVSQSIALENALTLATVATRADIDAINQVAAGGSVNPGPGNTAPLVNGTPASQITAGNGYAFQPSASDADGDTLTFSIANRPSWAGFNTGTGRLSGTPADQHAGTYDNIVISVSDGTDTASLTGFSIQVMPAPVVNTPPVISGTPAGSIFANAGYAFQPSASDAEGGTLTFSIANRPSWAGFNTGTGRLSGTPADQHTGTYDNIVISVSDGTDTASLTGFSIQVMPAPVVNTPPVISGTPAGSIFANAGYAFQPLASDADGDTLTFSIANRPSWAGFNTGTGRLSGTPADQHAGTYDNIVISVLDGTDTVSLPGFSIQVMPAPVVNTPPVISGSPAVSVFSNNGYTFQPSASDADGDSLSFSIANRPSWASFNTGTGRLSGTPADQHAGTYSNIVISVSDGTDTISLAGFSIEVVPAPVVNTPPVINGSPAGLVMAGDGYAFQPAASDADGDALTFSISNKPSWAGFNTTTGMLGGTPGNTEIGYYGNIVISVSDGTDTVSLPGFSIQVDPSMGSFTLSWSAPATRADGSALSLAEIDAYRIYYGPSPGNYTNSVTITDGAATSAVINNVQSGTWYVAMSTVDNNGLESAQSGAIPKVAN